MRRAPACATAIAIAIALLTALAAPASALPAGGFDTGFGEGGFVVANFSDLTAGCSFVHFSCGDTDEYSAAAVGTADGSVIVATPWYGLMVLIARFGPDGHLDTTFGSGGVVGLGPGSVYGLEQDDQGRVYVRWGDTVTRLLADGTVDAGYATGAPVTPYSSESVALAPDGSLFDLAFAGPTGDGTAFVWHARRYTPTGALDPAYGDGGVATVTIPVVAPDGSTFDSAVELAAGAGGELVIVGGAYQWPSSTPFPTWRLVVARLDAHGDPDLGGAPGGVAYPQGPASFPDPVNLKSRTVAVDDDGHILIGADQFRIEHASSHVLRLDETGALDPAFGVDGIVSLDPAPGPMVPQFSNENLRWLDRDAQGRIVLVDDIGYPGQYGRRTVVRLTADGALDPTFGSGGTTYLPTEMDFGFIQSYAVTGTGDVVIAGDVYATDRTCRFNAPCRDLLLLGLQG